ncbi:MAG: tetratricopeptide repeat protein [Vicinamibacterales bacterium]
MTSRRTALVVMLVAAAGVAGALLYSALHTEQEFDRRIAAGDQAVANNQPFLAIEAYSGAVALKPDSMLAHLKRGAVYQAQGELGVALRDLRQSADNDPSAPRPLELLGDVNIGLGRFDRAIERYERCVALDERNPRVLYKLGLARYRAGRHSDALEPLKQALTLDPRLAEAYYVTGLVHREQGQNAAARRALEQAVKLGPGLSPAREALAEVYVAEGTHGRAIDQLEVLAALEPASPDRLVAVGLAQSRAGRSEAALLTLGRAIDRFPEAPNGYAALGHIWLTTALTSGDRIALKKAVEALRRAAGKQGVTSETTAELGRAWMLSGDYQAAERVYRQALARLPVPADAYLHFATVTQRGGRIQDARDSLVKYAALVGDSRPLASIASQIADLSLRLGEPSVAVRWLDRAVDESGPSAPLLSRLAEAALKAGDYPRARAAVDKGLQTAPDDPGLLQLKRRLPRA